MGEKSSITSPTTSGNRGTPSEKERDRLPSPPSGIFQRARNLSVLTLLSRVLGVVREQIFARLFGAGLYADALVVAFRIPNLLRDLFAEGALSAAFIPALGRARERGGDAEVAALSRAVLSAVILIVGSLTILGILLTPTLVDTIASGFSASTAVTPGSDTSKREETIWLTRLLFPFLLLISAASVIRGVLNSTRHFAIPALGPPLANAIAIAVGISLYLSDVSTKTAATGWAIALLAGGFATLGVGLPTLKRTGLSLRPNFKNRHPEMGRILRQMSVGALGLAAIQVNILVGTTLASRLTEGSVAALNYGFRLVYLPIGVIGVAIATVATVEISSRLAAGQREHAARDLAHSLRLTTFLSLPAAVGLWILAEPTVRLIYEYGAFRPEDTRLAAIALRGYGVGLLFYAFTKVQVPACYALGSVRLPLYGSLLSMVCYTTWALLTYRSQGVLGLALGTSIAACVQALVIGIGLRNKLPTGGDVLRGLVTSCFLSAVVAGACGAILPILEATWGTEEVWARIATLLVAVVIGFCIVLGGGRLLRLPEAREVQTSIGLGRKPSNR